MLRTSYPGAVVVSARTGAGIDAAASGRSRAGCRGPSVEVRALIPYERGDLINRIHQAGEFLSSEHTENGTLVVARVHPELAGRAVPVRVGRSPLSVGRRG